MFFLHRHPLYFCCRFWATARFGPSSLPTNHGSLSPSELRATFFSFYFDILTASRIVSHFHPIRPPDVSSPSSRVDDAKSPDNNSTTAIIVGFACALLLLLGGGWFYRRHRRAKSKADVVDFLHKLRETVSSTHFSSLKELNNLDHHIKMHLANSDFCVRVCNVILDIVSDRIENLSAGPQVEVSVIEHSYSTCFLLTFICSTYGACWFRAAWPRML